MNLGLLLFGIITSVAGGALGVARMGVLAIKYGLAAWLGFRFRNY